MAYHIVPTKDTSKWAKKYISFFKLNGIEVKIVVDVLNTKNYKLSKKFIPPSLPIIEKFLKNYR